MWAAKPSVIVAALALLTVACGDPYAIPSPERGGGGGCAAGGLAGCGDACGPSDPCPVGLYCSSAGRCAADCATGAATCSAGFQCSADGRCVVVGDPTADGGRSGVCADVDLSASPVTPTVYLIVDQSGSMASRFSGGSRWDVLRDSLLADNGLIQEMQGAVRFGLALYSAQGDDETDVVIGECPLITSVQPMLNNYDSIATVYNPAMPIDETPTGDAISAVLDDILATPDPDPNPIVFVVATDGEPDRCEEPDPDRGQGEVIEAVNRAFENDIQTFVISVGTDISEAHLQDVANAGVGNAGGADAPFWVAGDDVGLRDALQSIVGGILSCRVDLNGRIEPSQACSGTVMLNGLPIPCDDPNGWRAVDEDTIELQGQACEALQAGAGSSLQATFPCEVVLI